MLRVSVETTYSQTVLNIEFFYRVLKKHRYIGQTPNPLNQISHLIIIVYNQAFEILSWAMNCCSFLETHKSHFKVSFYNSLRNRIIKQMRTIRDALVMIFIYCHIMKKLFLKDKCWGGGKG